MSVKTNAVLLMEVSLALKLNLFVCLFFFPSVPVPYFGGTFGWGIQPIESEGLICRGTESSLEECHIFSYYCNWGNYAGVTCYPRITGKYMHPIVNTVCAVSITR